VNARHPITSPVPGGQHTTSPYAPSFSRDRRQASQQFKRAVENGGVNRANMEPDPNDKCAGCGHERYLHEDGGCHGTIPRPENPSHPHPGTGWCSCKAFATDRYSMLFHELPALLRNGFEQCHDERTHGAAAPWFAADAPPEKEVVIHWPLRVDFHEGDPLFVGRALNGWENQFRLGNDLSEIRAKTNATEDAGRCAEWFAGEFWPHVRGSVFWQAIRALRPTGEGGAPCGFAWSNLAKISPAQGGNPPEWMWRWQFEHCKELLQMEIEHLKPGLVVCITGDWCAAFWPENWVVPNGDGPILCTTHPEIKPPWICATRPDQRPPAWSVDTFAGAVREAARGLGYEL
jgi:hypothetical protein